MLIPIIDWVQRNLHIAPSTQLRLLLSILPQRMFLNYVEGKVKKEKRE
ncbi:MAG: hypothetical protein J7J61_08720 [Candidatus Hydrothermae bacterium]|nr:hypothetical protein [Candidatus Hydrothermae bacterium]